MRLSTLLETRVRATDMLPWQVYCAQCAYANGLPGAPLRCAGLRHGSGTFSWHDAASQTLFSGLLPRSADNAILPLLSCFTILLAGHDCARSTCTCSTLKPADPLFLTAPHGQIMRKPFYHRCSVLAPLFSVTLAFRFRSILASVLHKHGAGAREPPERLAGGPQPLLKRSRMSQRARGVEKC